jgi:hypothetical protein
MSKPFLTVLENFDQLFDTDYLDEFRNLAGLSLRRQRRAIEKESESINQLEDDDEGHTADYASHIEDRWVLLQDVENLAGQLLVVALYRQTELHIKRVVKRAHPNVDMRNLFIFEKLKKVVPFDIEILPKFATFNELRLLNNSVKHQGKVSDELSDKFPSWKHGEELIGLDAAYERMKPEVAEFIRHFVNSCHQAKKTQP